MRRLLSPAGKYLVRMVMLMAMVMTAAFPMTVVMLMTALFMLMVVMLMVVMPRAALLVLMVVMLMIAAFLSACLFQQSCQLASILQSMGDRLFA